MKKLKLILSFVLLASVMPSVAQEYEIDEAQIYRSPLKKILNKFSFTVTTGYGKTNYSHKLEGLYLIQSSTRQYIADNDGQPLGTEFDVYSDWFNNTLLDGTIVQIDSFDVPFQPLIDPVNNPLLKSDLKVFNADSLGLGFSGKGTSIPIALSFRYNYQKFRIGLGYMFEYHLVKPFVPTEETESLGIRNYTPNFKSALYKRFWAELGYRFYDFWDYSFAGELQIGKFNPGGNFNSGLIQRGMYYNFGISIEKNLSEYFRIIIKPSYDLKNYKIGVPGLDKLISHKQPTFFLQVGISITFPEIPRSPIKSDRVQLKHVITDPSTGRYMEVRGQPIYKKQNPKVGENHRKLWRYKNRNKKKLNPY
ncbi:MAG: hypothetical protein ACJA2S_002048 [Cyclobacteriaceae bacterium]